MEPSRTATQRPLLPPGAAMHSGTVTLEGVLDLVGYANPETGWTVVKLTLPGRPDLVTVKPATLAGIEKYLGSGLVPGIGRVMAERAKGPERKVRRNAQSKRGDHGRKDRRSGDQAQRGRR